MHRVVQPRASQSSVAIATTALKAAKMITRQSLPQMQISHPQGWRLFGLLYRETRQLLWMMTRQWYMLIVQGNAFRLEGFHAP